MFVRMTRMLSVRHWLRVRLKSESITVWSTMMAVKWWS